MKIETIKIELNFTDRRNSSEIAFGPKCWVGVYSVILATRSNFPTWPSRLQKAILMVKAWDAVPWPKGGKV